MVMQVPEGGLGGGGGFLVTPCLQMCGAAEENIRHRHFFTSGRSCRSKEAACTRPPDVGTLSKIPIGFLAGLQICAAGN